jgi:hypothetical protein
MKSSHDDAGSVIALKNGAIRACRLTRVAVDRPVERAHRRPHMLEVDLVLEALSRIQAAAEPNR